MNREFYGRLRGLAAVTALWASLGLSARAAEAPAWTHEVVYTIDVAGALDGPNARSGRVLDNLDVIIDGDLERAIGWQGARVHLYLLNNGGGQPNDVAGTLQGIDNIEVGRQRARLYELWFEQDFGGGAGSILGGLYDLNSEFYTTDAADQFIAPPFGIGSEIAATGVNGPSIFPSTALGVRVRLGDPDAAYLQGAVLSADARTLGDPGGVDFKFENGALVIAEAGWKKPALRVAAGAWRYTKKHDDIRLLNLMGDPADATAQGAYLIAEGPLHTFGGDRVVRGFMRVGVSDGDTTSFKGGWQAGLRMDAVMPSRPDSALSFGVHQGRLSQKFRANGLDAGVDLASSESGAELTYSDTVGRVTFQPDLQVFRNPGGEHDAKNVVVGVMRVSIALD